MARKICQLSTLRVTSIKEPGLYHDGAGLYLQVSKSGTRSWIYRFMLNGRQRDMGLGPFPPIGLAEARSKANEAHRLKCEGIDPLDARGTARQQAKLAAASVITFRDAASQYIAANRVGWKNEVHRQQWPSTLTTYVYPTIGSLSVQAVDVDQVMKVLEPIWSTKTETASRVRQRMEAVLDWATVRGYRTGENPARWRGHLDKMLPRRSKVQKVQHHSALSHHQIGQFMYDLRQRFGVAAQALEFLILTASRTSEVRGARWSEIDLNRALWTIPATRIKAGREHQVPLSKPALALLKGIQAVSTGDLVFTNPVNGRQLSSNAILALLKRMQQLDITAHGFRSTFRDWAAESTSYPSEVIEMSLAHAVKNRTEAAYFRSNLFFKRVPLMQDWANACDTIPQPSSVVPLGIREVS